MQPLGELLASDHRRTLEFFYVGLQEVVDSSVDRHELLYNASVLAHHAQVSAHAENEMPTPATLADTFDNFVLDASRGDRVDALAGRGLGGRGGSRRLLLGDVSAAEACR